MPSFDNVAAIKRDLYKKTKSAVKIARNKAYLVIREFLNQYYYGYTPDEYMRTYRFLCSLVKDEVKGTGTGWEAKVYFDVGKLVYANKVSTWTWDGEVSATGDPRKTLEAALHGSHGGHYVEGTEVWGKTERFFDEQGVELLKRAMIDANIPILE